MIRLVLKAKQGREGLVAVKKKTKTGATITFWVRPEKAKKESGVHAQPDKTAFQPIRRIVSQLNKLSIGDKVEVEGAGKYVVVGKPVAKKISGEWQLLIAPDKGGTKSVYYRGNLGKVRIVGDGKTEQMSTSKVTTGNIDKLKNIVKEHQATKIGGVMIDVQTANLIVQIYDKLSDANKKKFAKMPMKKMGALAWQMVSKSEDNGGSLFKAGQFGTGTEARAKRNVYAEGMKDKGMESGRAYAIATSMVKEGAKPAKKTTKKDLKAERKRQKKKLKKKKKENPDEY
jgi:hypothetical protein